MSVATEFAPSVSIPAHAQLSAAPAEPFRTPGASPARREAPSRLASVSVLRAPDDLATPPLRLTRRGTVVLTLAVALLGAALVWIASLSAPAEGGAPAQGPAVVTVNPGDTLWSIAERVAPQRDPRAEVAQLQKLNGLHDVDLAPGQQLRVR